MTKPTKPVPEPEVIAVVWDDAVADSGWKQHAEAEKPQRCTSIGLVVVEDERCVVLAGSWGMNGGEIETDNRITIPVGWIVERRKVEWRGKRAKPAGRASR